MFATRAPQEAIDRYAGPYERWVFSPELGRPFAFPAIAAGASPYHTGLLEGTSTLPERDGMTTRLPPLWGIERTITPFAFHRTGAAVSDHDTDVAQMLNTVAGGDFSARFRVNFPISPAAWTPNYKSNKGMQGWAQPATRPKAIVAVIDDAIPFANRAFEGTDGRSRISHCWLQSAAAEQTAGVPFGRELMNAQIDSMRAAAGDDDAKLYRDAAAIDAAMPELGAHLRRGATHGSHVLGAAAGNAALFNDQPQGDDIQIIAVQLPNTIAWDTSGFGKEMYMLSAIHYVMNRARMIADRYADGPEEIPLIINFSYGWNAGRHDAGSEMEIAIDALLAERQVIQSETALVMPTGNNYASGMHARLENSDFSDGSANIGWQVLADDQTSSYLELWFPEGMDAAGYSVTVTPPTGTSFEAGGTIPLTADPGPFSEAGAGDAGDPRRFSEIEMDGQNIGQLSADFHLGSRWRVMLAIVPTAHVRGQSRVAPVGRWTVTINRPAAASFSADEALNIWVQRDDDPTSLHSNGRQSYLVGNIPDTPIHPIHQFTSELGRVSGYGALNAVSTSDLTTRVGGYVASTGRPSAYSAAGGLRRDGTPWGAQTTVSAAADISAILPGCPSIGVMSGAGSRLTGTSGASPAVARLMAINAAAGRPLMHGFDEPAPIKAVEPTDPIAVAKYAARIGSHTIKPISHTG